MTFLRNLLLAFGAVIFVYTLIVVAREGVNFLPAYVTGLFALNWSGQITLDFTFYLMLSGLWLAWRSGFSTGGIAQGLLACGFGMLYFIPQMLVLIARSRGDLRGLLLGVHLAT